MNRQEAARWLGVDENAPSEVIRSARNRLALEWHPDVGGSAERMALLNAAFAVLSSSPVDGGVEVPLPSRKLDDSGFDPSSIDRPSFVINRLPAEAFELLLVASRVIGDVADEDPPYVLEVLLEDPPTTWCRLELVPDAGATTVSIITDGTTSAAGLCRVWVDTVNEIDFDPQV
jgi:hypothetical protein